jgi:hypothetical protein
VDVNLNEKEEARVWHSMLILQAAKRCVIHMQSDFEWLGEEANRRKSRQVIGRIHMNGRHPFSAPEW